MDSELDRERESRLELELSLELEPRLTPPQEPPPWCAFHKHGAPENDLNLIFDVNPPPHDIPPCKLVPSLCDTPSSNVSHTWNHIIIRYLYLSDSVFLALLSCPACQLVGNK